MGQSDAALKNDTGKANIINFAKFEPDREHYDKLSHLLIPSRLRGLNEQFLKYINYLMF